MAHTISLILLVCVTYHLKLFFYSFRLYLVFMLLLSFFLLFDCVLKYRMDINYEIKLFNVVTLKVTQPIKPGFIS